MRPLLALFVAIAIPLGLFVYISEIRPRYQPPPAPPKPPQQAADRFVVELTATFSARTPQAATESADTGPATRVQAAPALLLELREQGERIKPRQIEAGQTLRVPLTKVSIGRNELIVSANISAQQAQRHHALHLRILRNRRLLPGGEKIFWLPPVASGKPLRATFPFNVPPGAKEANTDHEHP